MLFHWPPGLSSPEVLHLFFNTHWHLSFGFRDCFYLNDFFRRKKENVKQTRETVDLAKLYRYNDKIASITRADPFF